MRPFLLWLSCVSALLVALSAGAAGADPPVGTFKIALGEGNFVYTLGGPDAVPFLSETLFCARETRGLGGHIHAICVTVLDSEGVSVTLSGTLDLLLAGDGPDKSLVVGLKQVGSILLGSQPFRWKRVFLGGGYFGDGDLEVSTPGTVRNCFVQSCSESPLTVTVLNFPDDGPWKLKLKVREKEPGVLRGKAVARVFQDRVRYKIQGTYDAMTGTAALDLIGKKKPSNHSIALTNVMVFAGQVTGQLAYDLFGQTGGTDFDVPLTPPAN